ncbi:dTDP-4-dehydrorhamnose reductase family protein [Halobacteriaceae archaeon SHR40]|uniref:SDR family oxidoreductase n=1 Tax=Halovenus amylolytica TaxID=2500550 RepID=UPI000FE31B4E
MDLLVLGGNGLLGSNVVQTATGREWEVATTYHSEEPTFDFPTRELDIRDRSRFEQLLDEYDPEIVVNCAAMTDVDGCQRKPDLAQAVNARAPKKLARACEARGIDFCHISTDYVFDGTETGLYDESATPAPIQMYGTSKLAGDIAVRDAHSAPLIVRPSFIYGVHKPDDSLTGFPAWVRSQLRSSEQVPLFRDQHITPSRAGQVGATLLQLVTEGYSGTFNIACRSCTTPYEFGMALRERLGLESVPVEPASLSAVERPAARPQHTCLDVRKVEGCLDTVQPTLDEDLDRIEPVLEE